VPEICQQVALMSGHAFLTRVLAQFGAARAPRPLVIECSMGSS